MNIQKELMEGLKILSDKIENQKETIIQSKLIELGIDIPSKDELKQMRFNPFLVENHEGFGELIYFNDGTKNGKFVVGFKQFNFRTNWNSPMIETSIDFAIIENEPDWNKK